MEPRARFFSTSGTQSNLLALLGHCARGDEFIVGQRAHSYKYEGGGAASLGSIHPYPLEFEPDGTLDLDSVAAAVRPENVHFPRTTLVCLENTQDGHVLPLNYLNAARRLTDEFDLRMHLDGARIFNAAVKLAVPVREYLPALRFDRVLLVRKAWGPRWARCYAVATT